MRANAIPAKFPIPFADQAGASYVRDIPEASQISTHPGWASLTDGFPPLTMVPEASGGVPPFGQDFNGILRQTTSWARWASAGGPIVWDSDFSAAIGGYPNGAVAASPSLPGVYYLCLADDNTTNPDAGGANWKAFTPFGSAADYYVDKGIVNALAITPQPAPNAYTDGMSFLISPLRANTGPATLAVNTLSAEPIVHIDGSALQAGEVQPGQLMRVAFIGGQFQWLNPPAAITRAPADNSRFVATTAYADRAAALAAAAVDIYGGQIYGLRSVPTPGSTTNSITVSVGSCRDTSNTVHVDLTTPMAKRLDQAWVAGNGNGGRLDATALAAGQTWFLHIFMNSTTGQVDWGYSQSPTNPPLPTGYDKFRRFWAILLGAFDTNIRQFVQAGDYCEMITRSADYAVQSNGGAPSYRPVAVPVGIKVNARFYFQSTGTSDSNPYLSGVYDPDKGVPPAFGSNTQWAQIRRLSTYTLTAQGPIWDSYGTVEFEELTDNTGHIYTVSSDPADVIALGVLGWWDPRGRFYP